MSWLMYKLLESVIVWSFAIIMYKYKNRPLIFTSFALETKLDLRYACFHVTNCAIAKH